MPVDALELDLPPVHVKGVSPNLLPLEADALHADVVPLADDERVEVRRLGRPERNRREARRRRVRR